MSFGEPYPKINGAFKRDNHGVIIPGNWSVPEFAYLQDADWEWTEKVDGTNIRLHWNGTEVSIGGRTDNAQLPQKLVSNLSGLVFSPGTWENVFPDCDDVTVYGEGYGAGIQSGGNYSPDQEFIVFDVKIGQWWLKRDDVIDVAGKLGQKAVPFMGTGTLNNVWEFIMRFGLESDWDGVKAEGLVGRPAVDLYNRKGDRIVTKLKVKDWEDYQRRQDG